MQTLKRGCKY